MKSFKKRYKNKKFNLTTLYSLAIITCVIFLTLGYSAFQSSLQIEDISAVIRVKADIRITNVSVSGANGGTSNYKDYNVKSITSAVNLPNQNSTITYHIEVTNIGNVKQGIYAIDEIYKNINSNTDSDLEIKSTTVNLKEELCDDNNSSLCKLGSVTTFDITIGYKSNGYNGTNLSHLIELDFDFRRIFDITYNGFTNVSGLPTQMIYGDTKTITFNNTTSIPNQVIVTGATGSYSKPILTLSNITIQNLVDTIVVTKAYNVAYVAFAGNTSGLTDRITAAGGTIQFNSTTGIPTQLIVTGATSNYNSPNLQLTNVTADVTITNAYNVTYVDFSGDTSGLANKISATGGTIQFNSTTSIPDNVTVTGATANYNSPNLQLTNVTGNITITASYNSGGNGGTWDNPVEDNITTIYNPNNVPEGTTLYTAIAGEPKVTADSNGNVTAFEYTNTNGGITINNSNVDTGMIVFDGRGFEMDLVFEAKLGENLGNNVWGAIQSLPSGKYAGFNMSIRSNTFLWISASKSGSLYATSGAIGSSLHPSSSGFRIASTYNTTTRYTINFVYLPANYGTNTNSYASVIITISPLSSGTGLSSPYTVPQSYANNYVPSSLDNAKFVLGGNGLNSNYNMVNFKVISFNVHKI